MRRGRTPPRLAAPPPNTSRFKRAGTNLFDEFYVAEIAPKPPPPLPPSSPGWDVWPRVLETQSGRNVINLIGIQPYSGPSTSELGYKIEPAISLALEHVENHSWLLPNHTFAIHFYDSACNQLTTTDALFEAHNTEPKKLCAASPTSRRRPLWWQPS